MTRVLALVLFLIAAASCGYAASIRVAPVLVDVTEPTRTAVVTLRNEGTSPITVQARIFRWRQAGGLDQLEPTTSVVASPPIGAIGAGAENIIRIVRVAPEAVVGEESYRLIIDQLPDAKDRKPGTINLLIRHSIPVFFSAVATATPRLNWSITRGAGQFVVTATNVGGSRVRISDLVVKSREGGPLIKANGLVGYVLAGSSARWRFSLARNSYSGMADLIAQTEAGPIHAQATISR